MQCAIWRQTLLNKTGPDIYVGQYWFFDSLTFFDWIKSDSTLKILIPIIAPGAMFLTKTTGAGTKMKAKSKGFHLSPIF